MPYLSTITTYDGDNRNYRGRSRNMPNYSLRTYTNEDGFKCRELKIHKFNNEEIQIFVDKNNDNKFDSSERESTTIHYFKDSLLRKSEEFYYDSDNDGIAHERIKLFGKFYELPFGPSKRITNVKNK